jgi:hypothetical protein
VLSRRRSSAAGATYLQIQTKKIPQLRQERHIPRMETRGLPLRKVEKWGFEIGHFNCLTASIESGHDIV